MRRADIFEQTQNLVFVQNSDSLNSSACQKWRKPCLCQYSEQIQTVEGEELEEEVEITM